ERGVSMYPERDALVRRLKPMCQDRYSRSYALTLLRLIGKESDYREVSRWTSKPKSWLRSSQHEFFALEPRRFVVKQGEQCVDWIRTTATAEIDAAMISQR